MAKPTAKQFFIGYACVFVGTQWYVAAHTPPEQWVMAFSMVNMLFVLINMIGVCFATSGWAPWRDNDEPPPKHSVTGFFRWIFDDANDPKYR